MILFTGAWNKGPIRVGFITIDLAFRSFMLLKVKLWIMLLLFK